MTGPLAMNAQDKRTERERKKERKECSPVITMWDSHKPDMKSVKYGKIHESSMKTLMNVELKLILFSAEMT